MAYDKSKGSETLSEPLLRVQDLHTQFHTPRGVIRAVDGVSFDLWPGETIALVGESGCGKTVTALSLMGLVPQPPGKVTQGSIEFEGQDILKMESDALRAIRGNDISMIFQDPMTSLNPVLTVGRQISEMLIRHLGMRRSAARARAIDLLHTVGIPRAEKRIDDCPHQFSGGMRQRVVIAAAISCNPKIIVADEPTTALDVTIQAQILELLQNLAQQAGTATILITHDLGVVAGMADRIYVMYAGRIVEETGTPELFSNPQMPYTWGLLNAIPRLGPYGESKVTPIEGAPPDGLEPIFACRFLPRCDYAREICADKEPDLSPVGKKVVLEHRARCWGTQDVRAGGWLINDDGGEVRISGRPRRTAELDDARLERQDSSPPGTSVLLEVRGLKVHFDIGRGPRSGQSAGAIRAVDGIDLEVLKGETLGVVGESGSGKSTTARAILKLLEPTSGSIKFDGTELVGLTSAEMRPMRRRMQMIFQDPRGSLNPRKPVGKALEEVLKVHGLREGVARRDRVMELLELVGLSPGLANRFPHELSGGQSQRVGVARALSLEPDLLIADEPVSALDVSIQAQITNLLDELQERLGLTYIFIAHDLSVVRHISDRVAVMHLGKIVELADTLQFYDSPLHPYTTALISAVPIPDPEVESVRERIILEGDAPSPDDPPSGCRFRTRCWKAQEICSSVEPELLEHVPGQWAACHFPESNSIPEAFRQGAGVT